ncbi:PREDICTED: uncharacterized protein LOC105135102 [Populus euphratica]|uniref:Uncharacterized protein LOC105135102 n=1 Tax=Populus euphratica TaxID=75702 RepID=A0AAJ6UZ23_POPEU|nr:PREDICTED: uncharacterized protein LOC105135102 [Populus euphratica]
MVSEPPRSHEHSSPIFMAETQGNAATTTVISNPAIITPNSLIAINAAAQLPLKLTPINYLTWHAQFNALLIGYDLLQYVDGSYQELPKCLHDAPNPAHIISDELSIIGEPPSDIDLVVHVLNGLGPTFKEIAAAIRARDNPISFEDLHDKLVEYENFLKREEVCSVSPSITARVTQRFGQSSTSTPRHYHNNKVSSNNRGYQSFSNSNHGYQGAYQPPRKHPGQGYKGFYQLCDQQGHSAKRCPRVRPFTSTSPTTNYTTTASSKSPNWLLDSAASHHVTDDLTNLSLTSAYEGSDAIVIGDGTGSPHEGDSHSRPE